MQALNLYLQNNVFKNLESFIRVYALRKKVSINQLRKEIEEAGIRIFFLHKIAYD